MFLLLRCFQHLLKPYELLKVPVNEKLCGHDSNSRAVVPGRPLKSAPMPRVALRGPRATDQAEFLRLARASRRFLHPWSAAPSTPRAFANYLWRARRPTVEARLVCRRADGAIL